MKEHGGEKKCISGHGRGSQSLWNEQNLFQRKKSAGVEDVEGEKVCRIGPSESMFHAERKTKQQSVRARASLQHGPLIMQEVTDNGLLWAAVYYSSLFDLDDEARVVYSYKITLTGWVFYALIRPQLNLDADAWTCAPLDHFDLRQIAAKMQKRNHCGEGGENANLTS